MEQLTRSTPSHLPIKILAIGAGGLHRALTHELVDELNQRGLYSGGIFVGQPRGTEKADILNRQGGLYHVVSFELEGVKEIKQVSSVVGATTLSTQEGRGAFYAHTEHPLDLILVGVTEAGIAKGQIAMDVLDETLYRYFSHHGADSTLCVINTDNIRNNGDVIQRMLGDEYPQRTDAYTKWLTDNVSFLNEMGDRLVPQVYAVPDTIKDDALQKIGKQDDLVTYAEKSPAISLILQDAKDQLRVPFKLLTDLGVIVTPDSIEPHHDWKLLLINSVHVPGITHKAMLSGIEYVNEAVTHPTFGPYLARLMAGYAKIVEADIPLEGRSAHAYTMEFIDRVQRVKDDNARINIIETVKLRERAADIIRSPNYGTATEAFKEAFAYAVATVLRFLTPHEIRNGLYTGITDVGATYEIRDPDRTIQDVLWGAFGTSLENVRNRMEQVFSDGTLWTPPGASEQVDLSLNRDFMRRVEQFYHQLVNGDSCLEVLMKIDI
jgi:mannitol-1-phosphate/altronate dehydrogenase